MKNLLILFCSLILSGVFGADEIIVLVKKGDSVTLLNYDAELQRGDKLLWTFNGDSNFIAKLDREENMTSVDGNDDWRFKDRLMLEILTGSLTINSITITNSGLYKLQIMATTVKHKSFRVTVSDTVKTFSVMLGDPVTLYTDTELQTGDTIEWKFGGNTIAYLAGPVDSRFTNSDVSHRTGDLNITDIRSDQSGQYEVKINSRSFILQRILHVNVRVEVKSVMEGDSFALYTGLTDIQTDDVIQWKFNGTLIANLTHSSVPNIDVNRRTGDLNITNIRMDQSGVYQIIGKGLQRTFRVNVKEPTDIYWKTIGPGLLIGVIVLGIIVLGLVSHKIHKCCRNRNRLNKKEENETCERLNKQSFNTNGT
ncbi:uncharacterized protein LOC130548395 isoform X1 [Triplophysa rosa]|uniref:uncharacterized protein LOC130548395 isoform X1 n=1 Tax=Triplophysa rosa TaxID=992332 RepID=UPI002545F1AB|nr:uncharacterized protein LOC130548395 isoform X1 [Triplophysa rosa]